MIAFLLWCLLFVACWPLALLALVLYPFVWVALLPFRSGRDRGPRHARAGLVRCHASGAVAECAIQDLVF